MKQYNEYNDKLISDETAKLAMIKGYDIYCPECFVEGNESKIIHDEWTGLIADGFKFLYYRPTQTSLQKWLREKNIIIFIEQHINAEKFMLNSMEPEKFKDDGIYYKFNIRNEKGFKLDKIQILSDSYEEALETGLEIALKQINKEKEL